MQIFDLYKKELKNLPAVTERAVLARFKLRVAYNHLIRVGWQNRSTDIWLNILRLLLLIYCQAMKPEKNWPELGTVKIPAARNEGESQKEAELRADLHTLLLYESLSGFPENLVVNLGKYENLEDGDRVHGNVEDLLSAPLFPISEQKPIHSVSEKDFPHAIHYWHSFFSKLYLGETPDWEITRKIAMIPIEDWDRGAEHIANLIEIEEIKAEIKRRIADLEADLTVIHYDRHGVGGNFPPLPVEEVSSVARSIVWTPLEELKDEIEKDFIDTKRLKKILSALIRAIKNGALWTSSKADLAVDTAIKWGIPFTGGYLFMNPEKLQAVVNSLRSLKALMN